MMRAPSAALRALPMLLLAAAAAAARDPLPSWHDGTAKARIIGFVQAATQDPQWVRGVVERWYAARGRRRALLSWRAVA